MPDGCTTREAGALPPGVGAAEQARLRPWFLADVPVRCRSQDKDTPPRYARRRFSLDRREFSGALGDLGTFIPHVVGAIAVVGMAPNGILAGFGAFYVLAGLFYGFPIAIQPMKAASAVAIVEPMSPGAIAGAGLAIGLFFLIAGATGLISRLARIVPASVAAGLQLGLGLSLGALGVRLMTAQPWFGLGISLLMLALLPSRRFPAALVGLAAGVVAGQVLGVAPPLEWPQLGFYPPPLVIPTWDELLYGLREAALPQIPLTLANAIIVAAVVTRRLYPREVLPASERNLSLTTGIGNLLAAPFGGYPMCHGSGGIAAHHRFGGRTATAPVALGLLLLAVGLFMGDSALMLMKAVPDAVVGGLLLLSGIELALSSRPREYEGADLFVLVAMGAICVAANPAIAFAVGLPLAWAAQRGWLKI